MSIALVVVALLQGQAPAMAQPPAGLRHGQMCPDWRDLPGTDGAQHSASDYDASVLVVVFTCNECPVAMAYENRLIALTRHYADRSVDVVAIHVNRSENLAEMKVRANDHGFPFPYLWDGTQQWAKAFGARVTPHAFVFNEQRQLVYQGSIDDNYAAPERVQRQFLRDAIEAALAGEPVDPPSTRPVGCAIRWR